MSRQWVKIYTSMLDDHALGTADPLVGWTFCRLIMLAGRKDDDGRLGTTDEVAWELRMDKDALTGVLACLNGRVTTGDDGTLRVRDWGDWQPPTTSADRMRRHRDKDATDTSDDDVTSHGSHSDVLEKNRIEKNRIESDSRLLQETPAPVAPDGADDAPGKWAPVYAAIGALWGTEPLRKDGAPLAWVGRMAAIAGRYGDDDPATAARIVEAWAQSDAFEFAPNPARAPEKLGQWLNVNGDAVLADIVAVAR